MRVVSPFVGGAFGSGLRPQYQAFLAVLAARELKRSVRVALTRQQMFTLRLPPAHHPDASDSAPSPDGTLAGDHARGDRRDLAVRGLPGERRQLVGPALPLRQRALDYKLAQLDLYTPCDMRAPGATLGVYSRSKPRWTSSPYKLGIDPLELRLRNYAEEDQNEGKPFTSKELRECYRQGAERFGWSKRDPTPRSMREGGELIGWGMATGVWEALQSEIERARRC